MEAISEIDTLFTKIIEKDIKYQYGKWYNRLKVYMIKFLAEKYFGVSDNLAVPEEDKKGINIISKKIAKNFIHKPLRYFLIFLFLIRAL